MLPLAAQVATDAREVTTARWQTQDVGLGVVLRRAWLPNLFAGPQCLVVLEVDRREPSVALEIGLREQLTRTSVQAAAANALGAVNGGFFLKDGKPRGLRRIAGVERSGALAELHACFGFDARAVRFADNASDWSQWPDVVEAGPRLVEAGVVVLQRGTQSTPRHPRTAVGAREDGVLLFVTVDGRTAPAAGLTLQELGAVMAALGCRDAINFDGGGSTTLWAVGFPGGNGSGIANHPCDDKVFDAAGERAVADVLLVHARAVVVVDDADATAITGAPQHSGDGSGHLGQGFLWARAGSSAALANVTFRAVVPRTGHYELQRRSVVAVGIPRASADWSVEGMQHGLASAVAAEEGEGWLKVGTVQAEVKAGTAVFVHAGQVKGRPFVVDAIRLVEMSPR